MMIKIGKYILFFGILKKDNVVIGINSNSFFDSKERNKHILMLDYDEKSLEEIEEELKRIQQKYDLPDMHIYKSSETGYHVYCFTPLTYEEMLKIVMDTNADKGFKYCILKYGYATLRITPKKFKESKITYVKTLKNEKSKREVLKYGKEILDKLLEWQSK